MDLSKFSDADLLALKSGDLSKVSDEGLLELKRQTATPSIAEQNLAELNNQGPVDELMGAGRTGIEAAKAIGNEVEAGAGGTADLVAGNGLDTAAANVKRLQNGEDATTPAANLGKEVGSQFTPAQIALMGGFGAAGDAVAPWISGLMKAWGEKAALSAVGMMRSIAETLNVDLSGLAQFLLKPIQIGEQTFAPIVRATSSTADMLRNAQTIQKAAGEQIAEIADAMDNAIVGAIAWAEENAETPEVILNLKAMKPAIEELKKDAVGGLEDVEPAVVDKFNAIIQSMDKFVKGQEGGPMATSFSDLSAMKTKLGNLTNFKSQTENNLAMQQAYGVLARTLSEASEKVGGDIADAYANANQVYHQVTAVINALTGKGIKFALRDLFAPGSMAFLGSIVGGIPGAIAGALGGVAADTYGRQAAAQGFTAAAPLVAKGIQLTSRGIPVALNAVAQGLMDHSEEGQ